MTLPVSEVVPVLDLSQSIEAVAEICRTACEEHGFFFITNTGISPTLVADHANAQRRFFELPEEQKRSILADENNRGYTPLAEETLDPSRSVQGDAKEGLYFGREVPSSSPEARLPLHGSNQWPDEALLPGYRQIVEAYIAAMHDLGMRMLRILSLALNLPSKDYLNQFFEKPMIFLRPLRYAPVISNEKEGKHAAGAHSDYGCLTFLWTDGTPGLQIFYKGAWVDVAVPETLAGGGSGGSGSGSGGGNVFIVNLGDLLERWTGGKFRSTLHRVVNPTGVERFSCPFFFEPSPDAIIAPLIADADQGENGRNMEYPSITALEYLLSRYEATHAGYVEKIKSGEAKI